MASIVGAIYDESHRAEDRLGDRSEDREAVWGLKWVKRFPTNNLKGQEVDMVVAEWRAAGGLVKRTEWEL